MPILQIRGLPKERAAVESMLKRVTIEVAKAMETPPSNVWAIWEEIPTSLYVEGGKAATEQPQDTHPPIVDFFAFEGRSQEMIERAMSVAAKVIEETLGLGPGNVFIHYREGHSGRVHSGGEIVRKR